jgi:RHS repeat-associated protein
MHQTFAQLPDYDSETDQYNTPNRHYNPTGRWLSPDPAGKKAVKLDDPQTWNMYAYVRNNPTTSTDPTGLACIAGITVFGSHFGRRCPGDTPPPPPPRPPSLLQTDQEARTAFMTPTRPSSRTETVYQIGGIVNAETQGMRDSKSENVPLSTAREQIAEVRINGDQKWGDKVDKYAGMQPPLYSGPDFQASLDAAANAAWNKLTGVSLTGGATNYKMTKSTSDTGPFYGLPIYTTAGPYLSTTPYKVINTYGPDIDSD